MEINLIIRELLAKHNYISLPGIGSFTQKYEPAFPSADGKSFIPPKQIISFDTSRTFNDEAIENYLCETQGISHAQASDLFKIFIDKLNYDLDNGTSRVFENVGVLIKNKKGKIKFEQAADIDAAVSTFGLKTLEVERVKSQKSGKVKHQKEPTQIESGAVKKSSTPKVFIGLSIVIVIAALVATFILIPEFRFWEQYSKADKTPIESKDNPLNKVDEKKVEIVKTDSALVKKDSLNSKIEQNIDNKNVKKTALYYEEPKVQDSKTYYLIVGSFGKIENAQKLSDTFKQKGFNPEIIQGGNMFRVSIGKTTDKNKALSDFNKYRTDYPNQSIWILGI